MGKYYIMDEMPDTAVCDLSKVVGTIEMLPSLEGKMVEELLKSGNFHISPYGIGEKDENGNVTNFFLAGFKISPGNGLE